MSPLPSSSPSRVGLPDYAELHCLSNFSFLRGASRPEELVERAIALGYSALAITDECSLAGVVRAHHAAKEHGFHLVIGSEMRLHQPHTGEPHAHLVLLAQRMQGYVNLSRWITVARNRAEKGHYLAHPGDLEGKVPTAPMLAGLSGCLALLVPHSRQTLQEVMAHAHWLKTWMQDRAFIAIELHDRQGDDRLIDTIRQVSNSTGLPIVAAGGALMHVRSRKPLQDVLTATRLNRPIAQCGHEILPNAEAHLRRRSRLGRLYRREWMARSAELARQCEFELSELKYQYPQELVPPGHTASSYLRRLTFEGARRRYPQGVAKKHLRQIKTELRLIRKKDYEHYFLTVAEIVGWAREQGILCQGRGSAANSLVCFCLGVTEVNPERGAQLLFGRFISDERNQPPDIDIDFEHQRREEVIQHIYAKYGRHRAALTAVVIRYRPRSALRDVGRALGIDLQRIEAVSKSVQWFDLRVEDERLRECGFEPQAPLVRLWLELTHQLIGTPRHLSQHPGGFVIAAKEIAQWVPVENAAMEGRSVIQWEKDDLESLGLMKVDILALGMLSALRRSLEFLARKLGRQVDLHELPDPKNDPTWDMICAADTVGVFQIESRAQMSMLPRLRPRVYYDLVVEVAIVRPGPIQGGMVHPYLKNRHLPDDQIEYPGKLKEALGRTKGVPIFQEQVMQIAILAADFTEGEADKLRRAMAAWKRDGDMKPFHDRLVGRMVENGYDRDFSERIFKQIQGFGEYGFPESHAAGFALLAYASSWLKCHHPDAFLAGLLNSQPMGFYAPAQLVRDARAHGVEVREVDVNISTWEASLEALPLHLDPARAPGTSPFSAPLQPVRLGLNMVSGLSIDAAERIFTARANAPFVNVEDLARRAALNAHELKALAQANALKPLAGHRHQAAWAVAGIDTRPTALLRATRVHETPALLAPPAEFDDMRADYQSVGLTLGRHPLAMLREQLRAFKVETAATLRGYPSGRLARASGIVTHRQRPPTANGTMFITLEDETGAINVIAWPKVVETQRQPLLASRLMTVYGQWQREGDDRFAVMHLVAAKVIDHTHLLAGLESRSRDFK
ncbi:error-prone DNA polymerase [Piscinibacter gummiphilus]|uniref:Error-prone DNA polymerase n=1 Tax=Piscinibacter gummiphilus TaxID=946333 RepID=A0ABZ0CQP5_9BURK|nr:error-prone DNA polymerase [Piscinibacter gummiphilus]WOB06846.1 error-prone DNA polymerase [Piscinibacter gummiphilus]